MKTYKRTTAVLFVMLILTVFVHTCARSQDHCNYGLNRYSPKGKYTQLKSMLIMSAGQVIFEACGDAMMDEGNKELGHILQLSSFGIALTTPYVVDLQRDKWWVHLIVYSTTRLLLFDYTYNVARGLPLNHIGSTSYWDKGLSRLGSKSNFLLPRAGFFVVGVSIAIRHY